MLTLGACAGAPPGDGLAEQDAGNADASESEIHPAVRQARAELGRLLFYDPILSADGETACATCHSEHWGMGDGMPLAVGVGAGTLTGPGRMGESLSRRNAPSLWNVAQRTELFWDGRARSLEEQAILPLEMPKELGLPPREALAALAAIPEYVRLFDEAFASATQGRLDEASLAQALAAFERTLVSDNAPYDAFLAGDQGALSAQMQRGLLLFEEVGCDACHTPPEFQSDAYADRGVGSDDDLGRVELTRDARDRGAFRVPGLRNARETGPYFHDGSIETLREAVLHETEQQAQAGARTLDDEEVDALTELVQKGLLDIARNPDRPEQVPSGLPLPRDGFRIPR